ncbi:choice-of-anchor B family protein [Alteromonas sp. ASW11-36]|uniref:Choice-of-anchor B family protein n=1 Tax=Alteromonas arenosi TaxID=3055817 RepID=A0ABT7T0F5_9ALTE|nr:choice-of-anchor B family protein [Alteromonas sp. ASW11-36]MDM7861924.1 choice-of-anchor B family protein [Alteromonas sp. ASW11-36]
MQFLKRRKCAPLFIMLTAVLFSQVSLAHSEKEKARFVAASGEDVGTCNNRFRPCKTIAYAVQQANKGDTILVAEGEYQIADEQDLLYLISDMQPVLGGFNTVDNYQVQQPSLFRSVLVGVPLQYADTLYSKGFDVIVDSKGIDQGALQLSLEAIELMQTAQAASPCEAGNSAGFECDGVSLLGRVPLGAMPTNSSSANDIWGHVDLNTMDEYAIIGLRRGIAVINVTDPENPEVVGSVNGQSTTWRDIKVYQYYSSNEQRWKAYAYAGADSVTEGLTIIDLSGLPNSIELVTRTTEDTRAHNVYISNVDYTTNTVLPNRSAWLHITGSENNGGSWRTFELRNATSPNSIYDLAGATRNDYTHDASSVLIDDTRADRDCVHTQDGVCNVMLDFNENELRLWDHTSSRSATELGSESYPNAEYVHSGWWSEDKQYVILHDELDEQRRGLNTTVHFFDISDLNSPQLVQSWVGPTRAIDHNGFTRGSRYYMSNYERGLTILDISAPTAPSQAGYFDTYGSSNNASFNGAWGVYPYLPSGNILVSDIQGGLYILKDETISSADTAVQFSDAQYAGDEGSEVSITVNRQGTDAISVDYHFITGSARDSDFEGTRGTLNWATGEVGSKTITVSLDLDSTEEPNELFFVRLSNPRGGQLLTRNTAFVTINGAGAVRGVIGFEQDAQSIRENQGTVSFNVARNGGSDTAIAVNYDVTAGEAAAGSDFTATSGTLNWADGDTEDKTIEVDILDDGESESTESFTINLSSSDTSILSSVTTLTVTIRDDENNSAPLVDAGDEIAAGTRQTLSLSGTASDPEGGELVINWEQTVGTAVTLNNADTLTPSFTAPDTAGTLTFELQVTDDFGVLATDSVVVRVTAPTATTPPAGSDSGSGGSLYWPGIVALAFIVIRRRKQFTNT